MAAGNPPYAPRVGYALAGADVRVRWTVLLPGSVLVLGAWAVLATMPSSHAAAPFAAMWLAMTLAMMVPTVVRPMMRAADGSTGRAWLFAGGFVTVWLAAGLPGYLIVTSIEWTPFWIALLWVVAGVYQLTPALRGLLSSCRSIRYEGDPVRYGVRQGLRCVGSCGPIMLAVMITAMVLPGSILPLTLLVGLTVLLCWEKGPRTSARSIAAVGLVMITLAAGALVLGIGPGGAGHAHGAGVSRS